MFDMLKEYVGPAIAGFVGGIVATGAVKAVGAAYDYFTRPDAPPVSPNAGQPVIQPTQ